MKILTKVFLITSYLRIGLIFIAVIFNLIGINFIMSLNPKWEIYLKYSAYSLIFMLVIAFINAIVKYIIYSYTITNFCNKFKMIETEEPFYHIIKKNDNKFLIDIYDVLYDVELTISSKGIGVIHSIAEKEVNFTLIDWNKNFNDFKHKYISNWEGFNTKDVVDRNNTENYPLLEYLETLETKEDENNNSNKKTG